jgi:1-acyl-sn-glycerol-3-phosphate acyltransferase
LHIIGLSCGKPSAFSQRCHYPACEAGKGQALSLAQRWLIWGIVPFTMNNESLPDMLIPWLVLLVVVTAFVVWLWRVTGEACEADWGRPWMNHLDGFNRLFCRYYHRLQGDRIYLPESGPAILVANHISGLDPLLLIAASRRPLRFIIASEQYHRFGLTWLFRAVGCIPVDRKGRPERAFRAALKALEEGEVVALFPHGTIHLDSDPPRRLKPGAVRLAQLADCPITPVRIEGAKAQRHIFLPVLLRARARVENLAGLYCQGQEAADCLKQLQQRLDAAPPSA